MKINKPSPTPIFHVKERAGDIAHGNQKFLEGVTSTHKIVDKTHIQTLNRSKLSRLETLVLRITLLVSKLIGKENNNIRNLLVTDKEAKSILHFYKKSKKISEIAGNDQLPHIFIAGKLDKIATQNLLKSQKAEALSASLASLQNFAANGEIPPHAMESLYQSQPAKIKKLLENIVSICSQGDKTSSHRLRKDFTKWFEKIQGMQDASGANVILQLQSLYKKKSKAYSDIALLRTIAAKIEVKESPSAIENTIEMLSDNAKELLKIKDNSPPNLQVIYSHLHEAINTLEKMTIEPIDLAFAEILKGTEDELAVYEVSSQRLADKFSSEILNKPIDVTMVGVEFSGFVKEGGLAEALEGMTKGMRDQHPDNKVRLIFPKFSTLPKNVMEQIDKTPPTTHMSSGGKPYQVYTVTIENIEYKFIDHPSFKLSGEKPSIYGPDDETSKARFAAFSGLAADLLKEVKTDVVHLHDWHVAGVALKLQKDDPEGWKEGKIPPVVFTYHNNSRAAQGRFGQGIYNYAPVIQGLIESGIATEHMNAFVEVMKRADAVTTVSETFGVESQDMGTGEGVSFAAREAAAKGKLTGIINGSNPHSWNPEKDLALKNWKDPENGNPIDLTYGPSDSNTEIVSIKKQSKVQLGKWIKENFPEVKLDLAKPIVTYVGRLDSYQKGLDKLEESIEATIKSGGQFIVMGSLEDENATKILDRLQEKYKENVLFIRDYKDPNGKYHYQQGDVDRQGCGSLIRAATDFLLMPSRFEPCGLVQFEGWLFGSLAIGSKVGGLADTIIPSEKDPKNFNGYLFDRDSKGTDSISSSIGKALGDWKTLNDDKKGEIIRRLISDGRKYSWTDSPRGYSPVEKYRFVYENARQFANSRGVERGNIISLESRIHKIRETGLKAHATASSFNKMEENYYVNFYSGRCSFKKLEKLYESLPEYLRMNVPSPYGRDVNFQTYNHLGAHIVEGGVKFAVEAPSASSVKVKIHTEKGDQTYRLDRNKKGEWTGFVPHLGEGALYQYIVDNKVKIDPIGLQHVPSPIPGEAPFSKVSKTDYEWNDRNWLASRQENSGKSIPTSIYEMHPSSWKKKDGKYLNYREIADELVKHCKKVGYSHVELMGILEHPDERSWGYQVTGFFAPNSRMGSPEDFKYLVNKLHENNIGVYLDWIPAHFAKDDYALSNFDGSNQYQPSFLANLFSIRNACFRWGTHFFDYKKKPVRNFLSSSAAYWIKEMHIDGLRIDAVRCMLLSDDPKASKRFLKDLNTVVHREFPGVQMIAEDYSGITETTKSVSLKGLGFDSKWNIAWMKHTMDYLALNPEERGEAYQKIVHAIGGDNFHKMVLAISHDEVKAELRSLTEKTPGITTEEKFSNLKALFGFMMGVPGKKLLFMGVDYGAKEAWTDLIGQGQGLTDKKMSKEGAQAMDALSRLNHIYKNCKAFWQHDDNSNDLTWIEKNDPDKRIHAYRRTSDEGDSVACLHNFSKNEVQEFVVNFENKEVYAKLKDDALEWKKNNVKEKGAAISKAEASKLRLLSQYPHVCHKIMKSEKLKNEFFKWTLVEGKSARSFLEKNGWQVPPWEPAEIFNSDASHFGGKGGENSKIELIKNEDGLVMGYKIKIPPLSTIFIGENVNV